MDLTTTVERMPVWGETVLRGEVRDEFRRQGRQSGSRRGQARRRSGDGHRSRRRYAGLDHGDSRISRPMGSTPAMSGAFPTSPRARRRSWSTRGSGDNAILIVAGANGDLSSPTSTRRAKRSRAATSSCCSSRSSSRPPMRRSASDTRTASGPCSIRRPRGPTSTWALSGRRASSSPTSTELAIMTGMPVESEAEVSAAAQALVCPRGSRR